MRIALALAGLALIIPSTTYAKNLEDLLAEKGLLSKAEASSVSHDNKGDASRLYYNGGTRLEFADAGITSKINVFLQNRYDYFDNAKGVENVSSFSVSKARLTLSGTALHNEFGYELESDFVGSKDSDGEKVASVKNAFISWTPCESSSLRLGQFKPMTSRQFNSSDQNLEFVDRSTVSNYFSLDREQGAAAKMNFDEYNLVFGAAIFNGESKGEGIDRSGVDTNMTGVVNARFNPIGKMNPYSEGDVEWTDEAAVSLGASYGYSSANKDLGAGLEGADTNRVSVDANFRMKGINVQTEYFVQNQKNDVSSEAKPQGLYFQAGYFIDPKTVELAARYGVIDCDNGKALGVCSGNDSINTAEASVNYYFWKHNIKAQFGYAYQNQKPEDGALSDKNSSKWTLQLTAYL